MSKSQVLPQVGDRVGRVCGPGSFPAEFQGTVVRVYADRFYANNADIQWDDGTTGHITGGYTTVGIGVYLLPSLLDQVVDASEKAPSTRYQVVDPRDGGRVMGTYKTASRARSARDKLDNQYGAYRYRVQPQQTQTTPKE